MSKFTEKRIHEIAALTTNEIPNAINNGISREVYDQYRMTLNLTVIQAVFGVEFDRPKKDGKPCKIKFNHKVANAGEIATITKLMDDFVSRVENGYISEMMDDADIINDADMIIPTREQFVPALPELEKVTNKKIHEYIFGSDGSAAISKLMISGMDVVEMAAVAEKIKKTKTRNTMLLIGGIALVVTGGAIAGVCINNAKKNKASINDDDAPVVELDDIDVDTDDMDISNDDDAPVVEFEE